MRMRRTLRRAFGASDATWLTGGYSRAISQGNVSLSRVYRARRQYFAVLPDERGCEMSIRWRVAAGALLCVLLGSQRVARAEGEAAGGFPNWSERVLLEWINRARADPQADLAACPSGNCAEKSCFTPQPPRVW